MGILATAISDKRATNLSPIDLGWVNVTGNSSYQQFKANDYENAYPSVTKIINKFMMIRPYTVDAKGGSVDSNLKDVLYHPNSRNSSVEFREALALMYLVHPKTHILIWTKQNGLARPGGVATPDNIAGFTFMENVACVTYGGKTTYTLTNDQGSRTFTDKEVITLRGLNPYAINSGGYSATQAVHKWTTIDDYIAQYQKGFFENGAVPTGQFVITAPTAQEFKDMVEKLKERHKGAGKNGNVTYTHRPVDQTSGKPVDAQIEWIPFATPNKELSLKDLFEQANKKIDSTFGVPASIRGVGENNNYATARTDQQNFMENVVDPITLKIWTQFTHELNRITGGLGVAIAYDIEIPANADEENMKEKTGEIRDRRFVQLANKGYSISSIKKYFESGDLEDLELQPAPAEEDNPDVDEGDEVDDAPDPERATEQSMAIKNRVMPRMQISARDYPDIYEGTGVDPKSLGCIMLNVQKISILNVVGDSAADDLVDSTDRHDHTMGAVAEDEPHVTLLFGLLENGNVWKDKVDDLLEDWSLDKVKVKEVSYFDLPDSYAIIAHIEETTDLLDGHNRLTLLPHVNTFSEYRPHMTLAYIKKDADIGRWIVALNSEYGGKELDVLGVNYGDLPESSDNPENSAGRSERKNPKAQLPDVEVDDYERQLSETIREYMQKDIDNAVAGLDDAQNLTSSEQDDFIEEMMRTIVSVMIASGTVQYAEGIALLTTAGKSTSALTSFSLSQSQQDLYREYLENVGTSYVDDTATSIRDVLDRGNREGWTNAQVKTALQNIMSTDEWRVARLANSEVNRSQQMGSIYSMQQIEEEADVSISKEWKVTSSNPCPICATLNGTKKPLGESFLEEGESISIGDGQFFTNEFVTMQTAQAHPNDHCIIVYSVDE